MKQPSGTKRILRKVWYVIAITLSVLVLVISSVGAVGTVIIEPTLVDVTQNLLNATAKTAGGLRQAAAQIDQQSGELRQISSAVSALSLKIGENIEDKGLVATLLPAEQERNLGETIGKIQETLSTVREFLTSAIGIYRSIDSLPFVDLPGLSEEKVVEIVQGVSDIQAAVAELKQSVQDFRSGVAEGVGRITQAADRVTEGLDNLHAKLTELDQALAALQDLALQLEEAVPLVFGLVAVFLAIFMAYVAYTQVEIIRLLVGRWKALRPVAVEAGPAASLVIDERGVSEPEISLASEPSVPEIDVTSASTPESTPAPEPSLPEPDETGITDPDKDLL
jgi:outer membrane murein-binding lipoprotein Lpp